jgi:riboflavin synthase alpha subunit
VGTLLNLESDILGRYIVQYMQQQEKISWKEQGKTL